jgi:hypothetical protein
VPGGLGSGAKGREFVIACGMKRHRTPAGAAGLAGGLILRPDVIRYAIPLLAGVGSTLLADRLYVDRARRVAESNRTREGRAVRPCTGRHNAQDGGSKG